jgi:conjugative relaxase-like TrwC/TraI family protein
MSLHKLTAGDGYLYLIRQVAAADTTERGRNALSDYYSAKGEAPGKWVGTGVGSLADPGARTIDPATVARVWAVPAGSAVTETQMAALFGEGLHPNAEAIAAEVIGRGGGAAAAIGAARLGRKFHIRRGAPGFLRALAVAYRAHNAAAGNRWNAPVDAPTRAVIRTALAREKFAAAFGRAPGDERELSGFIARETRARTTAVAGYDLTFSPVKSVSALWAIAPLPVSQAIEEAHDAAVNDVLAYLETAAAFTRAGTNGVAQVDTTGLIGAAFTHRDSRAGDPDLHTHIAISNKVATLDAHGIQRWLALDGQPLHRVAVAASELYNTRLEAHTQARLPGARFADVTPEGRGKRPVRELVGLSPELLTRWSSRRAMIQTRTAELAKAFQAVHGREPTNIEAIALAQQATLESRDAKHEPRSLAEQRHTWRAEALAVLGGHPQLTRMLGQVLTGRGHTVEAVTQDWISTQADAVIAVVSGSRASWQRHHVLAEAQRLVRGAGHAANPGLAEVITDAALAQPRSVRHAHVGDDEQGEPAVLRRRDGASVYSRHGTALYTSTATLSAERRIVAAATQLGGRRASPADVDLALAESAARDKPLNPGQAALVTEMATSGRRVALALAPAGTGKTTAMAALSAAWRTSGGTVIGLAPTAAAAIELSTDLHAPTDTIAKYVHLTNQDTPARRHIPAWFDSVDPGTLIIVDEAGKAGTLDLDTVIGHALARGASVRLVGDDGQLASISAGGVLRDIAAETDALTLSQLVRFTSPAEGAASLALRAGDPAGIGYYIDHHRVHVGAEATAADMAYDAWTADVEAGRDALLLAPTNDTVDMLNARARLDRLATHHSNTEAAGGVVDGREVVLADRLAASAGDLVRTRRNNRALALGRGDFVRNGYRFTILEARDDGSLLVSHVGTGRRLTLPATYVAAHVTLGYAATIDSAQGLTAGHSCHIVGAAHLTRQLLYVALTRGRVENHIYLSTAEADPHRILTPKATHPDTAVDVLSTALARDGAQVSARSADRDAHDPFTRLGAAADMYYDALGAAAENYLGPERLAEIDDITTVLAPGVIRAPGWPVLRRHLALAGAAGTDPATVLTDALDQAPLTGAADPAAVLDWRIDPTGGHDTGIGPLRWLPAIPTDLAADTRWGAYLARRSALVSDLADAIRVIARGWTPATAPVWARPVIAAGPVLAAEIAVFRAALRVAPADTRLLGVEQYPARARAVQLALESRAATAIGRRGADARAWHDLIDRIDPRIRRDGYWPQLAAHLAQAGRGRPDLGALLAAAAADGPLPDELPAAALWWRLSGALSPATLDTNHAKLRPPWTAELHAVFGSAIAETIVADPAWPGLVVAIGAADPTRWTPHDLLALAAEHLADADPDMAIAPYEYARLITYTVDLFTGSHPYHPDTAVPDLPPLSLEDEEHFPLDPVLAETDPPAGPHLDDDLHPWHPVHDPGHEYWPDVGDQPEPPEPEGYVYGDDLLNGDDLAGLDFADLSTTRPTLDLAPALADVYALRDAYHRAAHTVAELGRDCAAQSGPALRAAMPEILALRARADADRPYLMAVNAVLAAWADAEEDYDQALADIAWARDQLTAARADPSADPLDIASARADLTLSMMTLPSVSPAERYLPDLAAASAARAAAAGGADRIVTNADVEAVRTQATAADRAALDHARGVRDQIRANLDRAETAAAAAFAAAETRSAEHITAHLDALGTELRVLQIAGRYISERPINIPRTAVAAGLTEPARAALTTLAALPFAITPVRATPGAETTAALQNLRAVANAAGRKVLWCSPTQQQADRARDDALADTAATLADAHQRLRDGTWTLPAGSLLVVDDAATADPKMIADLAQHAAGTQSGLILLDTAAPPWPPHPSTRLLHLFETELPWTTTLTPTGATPNQHPHPPDLDPVLTQTGRLAPELLNDTLRQAITRHDQINAANNAAYQKHLNTTWIRSRHRGTSIDRGPSQDTGPDLPDLT